jgi:hypothetical protein
MKTNDTNTPQTRDTDKYPVTVEHVESTVFNGTKLSHNCICSLDKDHGQIPELITQATRQARLDELERVGVFLKSDYHINNHISQRIKELKNGK